MNGLDERERFVEFLRSMIEDCRTEAEREVVTAAIRDATGGGRRHDDPKAGMGGHGTAGTVLEAPAVVLRSKWKGKLARKRVCTSCWMPLVDGTWISSQGRCLSCAVKRKGGGQRVRSKVLCVRGS